MLLWLIVSGCYGAKLDLDDCAVPCGDACPDGYTCRNDRCVAEGSPATCALVSEVTTCADGCPTGCSCSDGRCEGPTPTSTCALTPAPSASIACAAECPRDCDCVGGFCREAGSGAACGSSIAPAAIEVPPRVIDVEPAALRAACSGLPYEATLTASGGEPPYAWSLPSETDLAIDPVSGVLHGATVAGAGSRTLKVAVRDARGTLREAQVSLFVRDRCWLAYVSRETGEQRLHVVDVGLTTRKTFPASLAGGDQVFDFAFSPDGRYLAFRVGPDERSARLHSVLTDATMDSEVPFAHPVLDYAWSADGRSMAVMLAGDELDQHLLSGFDAIAPDRLYAEREARYRGDLQWVASSAVIFQGQSTYPDPTDPSRAVPIPDSESPYVARAAAGDIGVPVQITALEQTAVELYATSDGLMTSSLEYPRIDGLKFGPSPDQDKLSLFSHDSSLLWSDDRQYVAQLDAEHRLELFALSQAGAALATSTNRCDAVLAWHGLVDRERVICLDEAASGCAPGDDLSGVIRVFDFFRASNRLEEALLDDCYQAAGAVANPRVLSRTGAWFVFDVGSNFAIANLDDLSLRVASLPTNAPERGYIISPDERRILWQLGNRLSFQVLSPPGEQEPISSSERPALAPPPCQVAFADAREGWCGDGNSKNARWSPDSLSLVYQSEAGALWLGDVSVPGAPALIQPLSAPATCAGGCVLSYAFQPGP
jgi:WD40-like Beta Propeller Repeat